MTSDTIRKEVIQPIKICQKHGTISFRLRLRFRDNRNYRFMEYLFFYLNHGATNYALDYLHLWLQTFSKFLQL